ncbi:hypothetical protein FSO04_24290 [Paraburkholderia madseniana]|uniref:Uncharacterized protein n=1 Tax=Paraburkholderia madseniana TaxID=2599607 RepID=A0A6N6W9L9_9BURK|nr:hypothetical protein [Paraburkholderia madseniana]KAE8757342.1 hypothetical protein FSO04_24290 [Paraburkholderia madseniana]
MKVAIARLKKQILDALKPYRVYVQTGPFDGASHKAWTKTEAMDWMRCYPNDCQIFVFSRLGLTKRFFRFNNVVMFRQAIR